jgi:hypothetical protein
VLNNVEICKYSKIISMSTIVASTTTTLGSKSLKLTEKTNGTYNNNVYKTGVFDVIPSLSIGESVLTNIETNIFTLGNTSASITIKCKPFQCTTVFDYYIIDSHDASPQNISLSLGYGDTLSYELINTCGSYGTDSISEFCITSACGVGMIPIIDITSCSTCLEVCVPQLNLNVSMCDKNITYPVNYTHYVTGKLISSVAIPQNEYVDICLLGINPVAGGTSSTSILRKSITGSTYLTVATLNSTSLQSRNVRMNYGDTLCYSMTLNASVVGSCSSATLCIADLIGSLGVNPSQITAISGNCVSDVISIPATPTTIAICGTYGGTGWETGMITTSPSIGCAQYTTVNYNLEQCAVNTNGCAALTIYCRPNGTSSYVAKCTHVTTTTNSHGSFSGSVTINSGDLICYTNCTCGNSVVGIHSLSNFNLTTATGSMGVAPTICLTKCRSCVTMP